MNARKSPSATMRWLRKLGRTCGYSSGVSAADRATLRTIRMSVKELHRAAHAEERRQREALAAFRATPRQGPLDPPPGVAVAE
jgi:hypothetical protein